MCFTVKALASMAEMVNEPFSAGNKVKIYIEYVKQKEGTICHTNNIALR